MRTIMVISFLLLGTLLAQENAEPRSIGLGLSLQSNQSVIHLPIVVSDRLIIVPAIGAQYRQQQGTDVIFGIVPKFLLNNGTLSPYIATGMFGYFAFPEGNKNTVDMMLRGAFGAEYSIDRHFSIGGDAGLMLLKSAARSLRFGNPDRITVQTDASLYVTFYF